ncbi:hypothetical protein SAY86_011854 [Trapa natans]|uniref:Small EDRK-rich factor-like N-terminal domain-containing protein n=1 Tax=Trapa natans TaxID=22666 RepID=A0AAN7LWB6_TRANT|nr:hypothetical protein SAY86_011854 [Trapa natans]
MDGRKERLDIYRARLEQAEEKAVVVAMGGGNGQKAKMAREKNMEKQKAAARGSQLDSNKKAMTIQVQVILPTLIYIQNNNCSTFCWPRFCLEAFDLIETDNCEEVHLFI